MINIISSFLNEHFGYEEEELAEQLLDLLEDNIDTLIKDGIELERDNIYTLGYDDGYSDAKSTYEESYDGNYDSGYDAGYDVGYSDGVKDGAKEAINILYDRLTDLEEPWVNDDSLSTIERISDEVIDENF